MNVELQQIPKGIRRNVALASLDLLASVIAAKASTFGSFYTLAINDAPPPPPPVGSAARPSSTRSAATMRSFIPSSTPVSAQA